MFEGADAYSPILGYALKTTEDGRSAPEPKYMVDVLINSVTKDENSRRKTARPVAMDSPGEPVVTAVPLSQVYFSILILGQSAVIFLFVLLV